MTSLLRDMACKPERCISDECWLTHHAWRAGEFKNHPRYDRGEVEMSLLIGRLSVRAASEYRAIGRVSDAQVGRADVRYATAGQLREAGLAVVHTPGEILGGIHASAVWPTSDPLSYQEVPWPAWLPARFDACFNRGQGSDES
jgi:hypothetical protein